MRTATDADCPEESDLADMLAGILPSDRFHALERHVRRCAECGGVVVHLAVSSSGTRSGPPPGSRETLARDALAALAPVDPGRFVLERELARGGMGRIVEAWDRRHGRRVAVKMLLKPGAAARSRFAREVRLTARLQHPAIIPLYEAGRWADDEPFFSMKLVEGAPLDVAVAGAKSLDERLRLLPNVIAMTEALAFAHEQGVIHRDLKPSNVLVGSFGETVVIDWGLAKELRHERCAEAPDAEAPPEDLGVTRTGIAIGTPCYMPPEQARGEAVDARADVYALGALLYHVLAGAPPYERDSSQATLERVLAGPPAPLREIAPAVPVDLATIVEKAMSRDAAARYEDARAMVLDLTRFEAGKRVAAHDYALATLLRRWLARNRAVVLVAAALLAVVAVVAGVSLRKVLRERDRADAANAAAEHERRTAVVERDAAEQLVAFVVSELRHRLEDLGRLDLLDGVGKAVDAYYGRTAPLGDHPDPAGLARRAAALETLAEVEDAKHDAAEASTLYAAAGDLRHRVVLLRGDDDALADEGDLLVKVATFEEAERTVVAPTSACDEAVSIGDALVLRAPGGPRGLALSAAAHQVRAVRRLREGDPAGAISEAAHAVDIARELAAVEPGSERALRVLGHALYRLGAARTLEGHFDEATMDEAIDVLGRLAEVAPGNGNDVLDLSQCYERRGFALRDMGRLEAAVADEQRAVGLRASLVEREPENSAWQELLGQAYSSLCTAQELGEHADDARASCRSGVEILARLAARTPHSFVVNDLLALAYEKLGWVLLAHGRFTEGEDAVRSAIAVEERFVSSGERGAVERIGEAHVELGDTAHDRGRYDDARREYRAALSVLERLEHAGPKYATWRALMTARLELANLDQASGNAAEARALRLAALGLLLAVPVDLGDGKIVGLLADACVALAASPGADADERATLERALSVLEPVRIDGESPAARLSALARARQLIGGS